MELSDKALSSVNAETSAQVAQATICSVTHYVDCEDIASGSTSCGVCEDFGGGFIWCQKGSAITLLEGSVKSFRPAELGEAGYNNFTLGATVVCNQTSSCDCRDYDPASPGCRVGEDWEDRNYETFRDQDPSGPACEGIGL